MAEIASVFVDPRYENQGIGGKLIHYAEDVARSRGIATGVLPFDAKRLTTSSDTATSLAPRTTYRRPAARSYDLHGRKYIQRC